MSSDVDVEIVEQIFATIRERDRERDEYEAGVAETVSALMREVGERDRVIQELREALSAMRLQVIADRHSPHDPVWPLIGIVDALLAGAPRVLQGDNR